MTAPSSPEAPVNETAVKVWCRHNHGWFSEAGVVHIIAGVGMPTPDYPYSGLDAQAALALGISLTDGIPRPVVGDMRRVRRTETAARRVKPNHLVKALAIFVESPVTRMLANAYLGITRPEQPTKVSTSTDAALNWLTAH